MKHENITSIGGALSSLLCSTHALYLKTMKYKWDMESHHFYSFYVFFDKQRHELFEAVDEVAERIRMTGAFPSSTLCDLSGGSLIACDESHDKKKPADMLAALHDGHQVIIGLIKYSFENFRDCGDHGSVGFLLSRLAYHEKTDWLIRSHFEGGAC